MAVVVGALLVAVFGHVDGGLALHVLVKLDLPGQLLVGRDEGGRSHPQRVEDLFLEIILPFHPGDFGNHGCGDVDPCVGIHLLGAGLEHDWGGCGDRRRLPQGSASGPSAAADVRTLGTYLERESTGVVEAHADSQFVLGFLQCLGVAGLFREDPEFLEFGKILGDRVVQAEFAFLDKLCDCDSAETFGLGALHERTVEGNGPSGGHVGETDAACFLDSVLVENADCARQFAALDIRLQRIVDVSRPGFFYMLSFKGFGSAETQCQGSRGKNQQYLFHIFRRILDSRDSIILQRYAFWG